MFKFKALTLPALVLMGFVNFSPPSGAGQNEKINPVAAEAGDLVFLSPNSVGQSQRAACSPNDPLAVRPTVAQAKRLIEDSFAANKGVKIGAVTRLYAAIWPRPPGSLAPYEMLYVEGVGELDGHAASTHKTNFEVLFVWRDGRWEKYGGGQDTPVERYRLELFFCRLTNLMPRSQ